MLKSKQVKSRLIFERWSAVLSSQKKTTNKASEIFDNLFYALFQAKISFDTAKQYLDDAAEKLYPPKVIVTYMYNASKNKGEISKADFEKEWKQRIKDKAYESFFSFYNIEGVTSEEKKYGSMDTKEYIKQRKYAESFPMVNYSNVDKTVNDVQDSLRELWKAAGFEGDINDETNR